MLEHLLLLTPPVMLTPDHFQLEQAPLAQRM
jgi:hypothetical protein